MEILPIRTVSLSALFELPSPLLAQPGWDTPWKLIPMATGGFPSLSHLSGHHCLIPQVPCHVHRVDAQFPPETLLGSPSHQILFTFSPGASGRCILLWLLYLVEKILFLIHFYIFYKIQNHSENVKYCCFSVRVKNDLILTTILSNRKPADLQNLAPGTHPPFITFNNEVKTDVNKIEEFLEEVLCPPK